jgi:hypothetical protein
MGSGMVELMDDGVDKIWRGIYNGAAGVVWTDRRAPCGWSDGDTDVVIERDDLTCRPERRVNLIWVVCLLSGDVDA